MAVATKQEKVVRDTRPSGTHRRLSRALTAARLVALTLPLLLCAILTANFWHQSRFDEQTAYYPFQWKSTWMTCPFPGKSIACFRKHVYVTGRVNHAYLAITADNFYRMSVNGLVPAMYFHPANPQVYPLGTEPTIYSQIGIKRQNRAGAVYNIGNVLHSGDNVICIIAESDEERAPRVAVQGEVAAGAVQEILADSSWKCFPQECRRGRTFWTDLSYPDLDWPAAVSTGAAVDAYVDGDVSAIADPFQGYFITLPQPSTVSPIVLKKSVYCSSPANADWIRVVWNSPYDLIVNDRLIASSSMVDRYNYTLLRDDNSDIAARQLRRTFRINEPKQKTQTSTDVYFFKDIFRQGENRVEVVVHGQQMPFFRSFPQIYIDGKISADDGSVSRFASDASWQAYTGQQQSEKTPVVLHQPSAISSGQLMAQSTTTALDPGLISYVRIAKATALIFVIFLVIGVLVANASGARSAVDTMARASAGFALPLMFLITTLVVQWIFLWSPQNEFLVTRRFAACILAVAFALAIVNLFAVLLTAIRRTAIDIRPQLTGRRIAEFADRYGYAACLVLIMTAAGVLYFHALGKDAFIFDEYVSILAAKGILHRGIPIFENSGILYPRSSLYHYILACFVAISDWKHDLTYTRVPSALWQLALIPVAYLYGRELKARPAGLIAAAVIAFSPYLEFFARETRFYSQFAFFSTLEFYFLLLSIRNPKVHKYRRATILAFCGAYLSQQITLGTIPAVALILISAGQFRLWMQRRTLKWLAFAAVVVLIDLGAYFIWCVTPLPFIDTMAEPLLGLHTDYFEMLPILLLDYYERVQLAIGILFVAGFLGVLTKTVLGHGLRRPAGQNAWPWWKFQYLLIPVTLVVTVTILPHPEPRYVCQLFPSIVVTVSCVAIALVSAIGEWFKESAKLPRLALIAQAACSIAVAAVLTAEARPVRSYNTTSRKINHDATGACQYIASHMRPGDKLMFFTPEVAMVEFGRCEYSWRPLGASLDKYIAKDGTLRERNSAAIVIDTPSKLRATMEANSRIWLLISPPNVFSVNNSNPNVAAISTLTAENFDLADETFGARVYLWDRSANHYVEAVQDELGNQFDFKQQH